MDDFNDLKNKTRKKLKDAKAELKKSIRAKEKVVELLEKDFNILDKFKIGNLIKRDPEKYYYPYYLIEGEPVLKDDVIAVPVRRDIYPIFSVDYCSMHSPLYVDTFSIPINELETVEVITVREFFEEHKERCREDFEKTPIRYKNSIKDLTDEIERYKEKIKRNEEKIAEYKEKNENFKNLDFEDVYAKNVEKYLNSLGYKEAIRHA